MEMNNMTSQITKNNSERLAIAKEQLQTSNYWEAFDKLFILACDATPALKEAAKAQKVLVDNKYMSRETQFKTRIVVAKDVFESNSHNSAIKTIIVKAASIDSDLNLAMAKKGALNKEA